MGIGFRLLAHAATLDIFAYKLCKTRPPIVGGHELAGFQESRMSRSGVIVGLCNNGASEIVGGGNIHATLVSEEIVAHLKVGEAGLEMGGDIVMKGLQVLQYKGIGRRGIANGGPEGAVDDAHKHRVGEEGDVIVIEIGVFGKEVWAAGQGVGGNKLFSRHMDQFEVEVR